jgi:hypothetical protein
MEELQRLEESYAEMGKRIEELKGKKGLPKTWEELGEIEGCYVGVYTIIHHQGFCDAIDGNRNVFATLEQAKASIALAQLSQLMKAYNGDWVPDWTNELESKYIIIFWADRIETHCFSATRQFLAFKTPELRDEFLKNFHELIMEAKPLL